MTCFWWWWAQHPTTPHHHPAMSSPLPTTTKNEPPHAPSGNLQYGILDKLLLNSKKLTNLR